MQMRRRWVFPVIAVMSLSVFAGCSDTLKAQIRSKDFRHHGPAYRPTGAASPIADVADMPSWTTDFESAQAFARENGQRILMFVQDGGSVANRAAKKVLNDSEIDSALAGTQRVTFDPSRNPALAARFGAVRPPAVILIDPNGAPVGNVSGKITKSLVQKLLHS